MFTDRNLFWIDKWANVKIQLDDKVERNDYNKSNGAF